MDRVQTGRIAKQSAPANTTTAALAATPVKGPRKKSFAEIMARAQRAQTIMRPMAGIQHMPTDKSINIKERLPSASKASLPLSNGQPKRASTMPSTTDRNGASTPISCRDSGSRNNGSRNIGSQAAPPPVEPVKKRVKKAALATTGYTGTARPRQDTRPKDTQYDGLKRAGVINPHLSRAANQTTSRSRFGKRDDDMDGFIEYDDDEKGDNNDDRRHDYHSDRSSDVEAGLDDIDDDMDGFIEYDDDDEGDNNNDRRRDYDSDGSSDMEAGLDDITMEERRAEFAARREDEAEEETLRKAKMLKDARKRRLANLGAR